MHAPPAAGCVSSGDLACYSLQLEIETLFISAAGGEAVQPTRLTLSGSTRGRRRDRGDAKMEERQSGTKCEETSGRESEISSSCCANLRQNSALNKVPNSLSCLNTLRLFSCATLELQLNFLLLVSCLVLTVRGQSLTSSATGLPQGGSRCYNQT